MHEVRSGNVVTLRFDSAFPSKKDESLELATVMNNRLANGLKLFVVSLAGVETVKAPDLGMLKGQTQKCREQGGELVVCCVRSEQVAKALEISRLDQFLTIRDSEDEAAEYLSALP
jgi:anti-anti-sigma factor